MARQSTLNLHPVLLFAFLFILSHAIVSSTPPPGFADFNFPVDVRKRLPREFLDAHNRVRQFVGEPPVIWNHSLALYARRWAKQRRIDCRCVHSAGPYGENIFWGTGKGWRATDAVRSWALEHYDYDPESNTCKTGRMCGHYTQIVWNATVMVGCARESCIGGGIIIICSYHPPGNFVGESPFVSLN